MDPYQRGGGFVRSMTICSTMDTTSNTVAELKVTTWLSFQYSTVILCDPSIFCIGQKRSWRTMRTSSSLNSWWWHWFLSFLWRRHIVLGSFMKRELQWLSLGISIHNILCSTNQKECGVLQTSYFCSNSGVLAWAATPRASDPGGPLLARTGSLAESCSSGESEQGKRCWSPRTSKPVPQCLAPLQATCDPRF